MSKTKPPRLSGQSDDPRPIETVSGSKRAVLAWIGLFLLLATEFALFSWYARDLREAAYSVIRVPLLRSAMLLSGLAVLALWGKGAWRSGFSLQPARPSQILLHLLVAMLFFSCLNELWPLTVRIPVYAGLIVWCLLAGLFAGSWLACLYPPRLWPGLARRYGGPLVGAFLFLTLTERLTHGPWAGRFVQSALSFSGRLLSLMFDDVVIDNEKALLGVRGFQVHVGHLCAGYEGISFIVMLLSLYLYFRRDDLSFPGALCVIPIAAAASWIANGFRLAGLVGVGVFISPELAVGAFHSRAGWVSFVTLSLIFVLILEKTRLFHRVKSERSDFPALPYLAPIMAQLGLLLVFSAFTEGLDVFYPARILLLAGVLWTFRKGLQSHDWSDLATLSAFSLGILVYAVWIPLVPTGESADPRLTLAPGIALIWILSRMLGSVVLVPLVEELAFRGYLLRRLQDREFDKVPIGKLTPMSVLLSSLAFGLLHQAWFAGFLAGLVYAYAGTIRGRLSDCVLAHAVTNLCISVHVIALHRWDLWI